MTLEELLELIKSGKESVVVAKFNELKGKVETLSAEISKIEDDKNKLSKAFEDEVKNKKTLIEGLGIKDEEFGLEAIKSKIGGSDEYKKHLSDLEALMAETKIKNELALAEKDKELFDKVLDLELLKIGTQINPTSKVALDVILKELKNGLTKDAKDGTLIYKDESGKIVRKDGTPLTVGERLAQIKENSEYSCFFKSEAQGGSGLSGNKSEGNGTKDEGLSEVAKQIKEKALKLGIKI